MGVGGQARGMEVGGVEVGHAYPDIAGAVGLVVGQNHADLATLEVPRRLALAIGYGKTDLRAPAESRFAGCLTFAEAEG